MRSVSYGNEVDLHNNKPCRGNPFSHEWFRWQLRNHLLEEGPQIWKLGRLR